MERRQKKVFPRRTDAGNTVIPALFTSGSTQKATAAPTVHIEAEHCKDDYFYTIHWGGRVRIYMARVGSSLEVVGPLVGHHAVDLVDGGGEGAQANFLRVGDDLGPGLLPLLGHLQVLVGVDQEVERTWPQETGS